jgi:hypothetical protein
MLTRICGTGAALAVRLRRELCSRVGDALICNEKYRLTYARAQVCSACNEGAEFLEIFKIVTAYHLRLIKNI